MLECCCNQNTDWDCMLDIAYSCGPLWRFWELWFLKFIVCHRGHKRSNSCKSLRTCL